VTSSEFDGAGASVSGAWVSGVSVSGTLVSGASVWEVPSGFTGFHHAS